MNLVKKLLSTTDITIFGLIGLYLVVYSQCEPSIKRFEFKPSSVKSFDVVNIPGIDTLSAAQILCGLKFKNYSLKSGYVNSITLEPLDNPDYMTIELKYIDKKKIKFMKTQEIKFCIICTVKSLMNMPDTFKIKFSFYDNLGKLILGENVNINPNSGFAFNFPKDKIKNLLR